MRTSFIFLAGLIFTFLYLFQIRHFIKEEGESIYSAVLKKEAIIYGLLAAVSWLSFMIVAFYA